MTPVTEKRPFPCIKPSEPSAAAPDIAPSDLGIIGTSPAVLDCFRLARLYAQCNAPVILHGATGTGKEVFARAIHYISPRRGGAFVPVNCGAIPEQLFEAELFGVTKGAYTGALADRQGLVELARNGTLFLDEIDCLQPKAQAALLRFLQEQEYRPVGSSKLRHADVRIVTATNANLEALVAAGLFRDDLLFRLEVCIISLPTLSERRGDIALVAQHFLKQLSARYGRPAPFLTPGAADWLMTRQWHGNLRQLENALHRALVTCTDRIDEAELQRVMPDLPAAPPDEGQPSLLDEGPLVEARRRAAFRFEARYLRELIATTGGNVSEAARRAGTERRAMGRMLKRHGLGR